MNQIDGDYTPSTSTMDVPPTPTPMQGFDPTICRIDTRRRDDLRRDASRRPPNPRAMTNRQRSTKFEGTCNACGKWGHPASQCHFLGSYLCLLTFLKGKTKQEQDECLANWKERNKRWLDRPQQGRNRRENRQQDGRQHERRDRGRQQRSQHVNTLSALGDLSQLYCRKVDLSLSDVADRMDWDFFARCARDDEFGLVQDSHNDSDSDESSAASDDE